MTDSIKIILKLEYNEADDMFRAIVSTTEAQRVIDFGPAQGSDVEVVVDIFESSSIDMLRGIVTDRHTITHYRSANRFAYNGDFGDALRALKHDMGELAHANGVNVSANANVRKTADAIKAAKAAVIERERLDRERAEDEARRQRDRDYRAAERKDFDAWAKLVRSVKESDNEDFQLSITMRWAYNVVDTYGDALAKHIEKLQENALHNLGWSGDFMQHAANEAVAKYVIELFESGVSFYDIRDEFMRAMFDKFTRSVSRSTSVMSNLMDDCERVAYNEVAKRLDGRSYW